MMEQTALQEFDAELQDFGDGGYGIYVPFDVYTVYGTRTLVRVRGTLDGHPYRLALAPMGGGQHVMGVRREIREQIGKPNGGTVHVTMELDTEPRAVEIPTDFQQALDADPALANAFSRLSYSHQREHVNAILEAKKPETRARRIEKAVEMIRSKL